MLCKLFKKSWLKRFAERNNFWNNTYSSTFRTCPRGYACLMLRTFGNLYNGIENIILINESNLWTLSFSRKLPSRQTSLYKIAEYIEYFGVVVVVPVDSTKDVDSGAYFVLPFDLSVWITYFLNIFYFIIVFSVLRYLENKNFDILRNFSYSILILLAGSVDWKPKKFLHRTIFLTMIMFGYIMVTVYTTYLGSFLIKGSGDQEFEIIINEPTFQLFSKFWNNVENILWKKVGSPEYFGKSLNLDSIKYGYCLHSNVWYIYNSFQKHLAKKIFRLKYTTSNSLKIYGHVLKPYAEDFKMYLMNIYSSGLVEKWKADNFLEVYIKSVITNNQESVSKGASLEWLQYPIFLSILGYLCSIVVFCFELYYK